MWKERTVLLAMCLSFLYADGLSFHSESIRHYCAAPPGRSSSTRSNLRMDLEGGSNERRLLRRSKYMGRLSIDGEGAGRTIHDTETRHDMPWRRSIIAQYTPPTVPLHALGLAGSEEMAASEAQRTKESPLLYMPFWSYQMSYMKSNLANLGSLSTSIPPTKCGSNDVSYKENSAGTARIVNAAFASDEYRKIRMTYYDAGDRCQVFNSLWYPHPKYNLPVLGIDLLAFNRRPGHDSSSSSQDGVTGKYLFVIDFQPIHESESDHASPYEHLLETIRSDYPSLQGTMTDRFYDHKRHFSPQMLYGRCESEGLISSELGPAFKSSVDAYGRLLRETTPNDSPKAMEMVLEGQAAYDSYSSMRDPARALFSKMFGEHWADGYVFDFLFDLSDRPCDGEGKGVVVDYSN